MALVEAGLTAILAKVFGRVSVVAVASCAAAMEVAGTGTWRLIVVEPALPDGDGLALVQRLRGAHPTVPIFVLSHASERHFGPAALNAGANGFLPKTASCAEIARGLARLAQGHEYASEFVRDLARASRSPFAPREGYAALSLKERAVLHALVSGMTPKEVAIRLGVAPSSVGTYRGRLLQKLKLRTTGELIRYGVEHRLDGAAASPRELRPAGANGALAVRPTGAAPLSLVV